MTESKSGPLDALEPGETTFDMLQPTVEFAGHTFQVAGFIGNGKSGGVLIVGTEGQPVEPETILLHCISAGINFLVMHGKFAVATPHEVVSDLKADIERWLWDIYNQHQATLAARGKPS